MSISNRSNIRDVTIRYPHNTIRIAIRYGMSVQAPIQLSNSLLFTSFITV